MPKKVAPVLEEIWEKHATGEESVCVCVSVGACTLTCAMELVVVTVMDRINRGMYRARYLRASTY